MPAQGYGHAALGDWGHAMHGQVSAVALQHQAGACAAHQRLESALYSPTESKTCQQKTPPGYFEHPAPADHQRTGHVAGYGAKATLSLQSNNPKNHRKTLEESLPGGRGMKQSEPPKTPGPMG